MNSIPIDHTSLSYIDNIDQVNLCLILVRRVATPAGSGKDSLPDMYYKYFGNGREKEGAETWSSSKIFAIANGAGNLNEVGDHLHNIYIYNYVCNYSYLFLEIQLIAGMRSLFLSLSFPLYLSLSLSISLFPSLSLCFHVFSPPLVSSFALMH